VLPGVDTAGAISTPPLGGHWGRFFTVENPTEAAPAEPDCIVLHRVAFPGYFETMGISLAAGRTFTEQDGLDEGSRAIIVNEAFAKRFWPGRDPLGQRVRYHNNHQPWMKVIGVARDVKHYSVSTPMTPGVYVPYPQAPVEQMAFVLRSSADPTSLVPAVRAAVFDADPDLAVFGVIPMARRLAASIWVQRMTATLFGLFAGVALIVALGGMYGVFSYLVNRRTQEIGVRLALGAQRRHILWTVLRQGLLWAGAGAGCGLVVSWLLVAPITHRLLYGIRALDALCSVAIALILVAVAMLACWVPARRAARMNPVEALRTE
jgi:putative ABC transport system permease protein